MKKRYLLSVAILFATFFGVTNVTAGTVTGMPAGYITTDPQVSTAAAPIWYNMMASNGNDANRTNRYMYHDGTNLKTFRFNSGITEAIQHDKYLWRLEQGTTGAGYVILVNKFTGKKIYADASIASDGQVGMADNGIEWKILASTVANSTAGAVLGQYCFNFEGSGLRYFNAGDTISKAANLLVFNGAGSVAHSSGWFFYPVTTNKTVTFAQPANGTIAVTGTNGTATAPTVTSGSQVLVGTVATVTVAPSNGYLLSALTVNGTDVTASVVDGTYLFPVNADATIAATFTTGTATAVTAIKNSNAPYISGNTLNIDGRLSNSTVSVYDLCGKQALSTNQSTINISSLAKGIYVVKYLTSEGIKTAKITK